MSEVMEKETQDVEVFELDDDFDPLEDMGIDLEEAENRDDEEMDYQAPIPDADRSQVPEPVELPPEERIQKLVDGIPGQKFRIYGLVQLLAEPKTIPQAAEELEADFPQRGNVYDAGLLMELLVDAGALRKFKAEEDGEDAETGEPSESTEATEPATIDPAESTEASEPAPEDDAEYLQVTKPAPVLYQATEVGLQMAENAVNVGVVCAMLKEEPQYLPIYERVLQLVSTEGGVEVGTVSEAVNDDELCQEPPRFAQHFLDRLERVDAVRWEDTWQITDLGTQALESDVFAQ